MDSNSFRTNVYTESDIVSDIQGIIIIDSEENNKGTPILCDEEFTTCSSRFGSVSVGGFAPYDIESHWYNIDIPVVVITKVSGMKLRSLMNVEQVDIPGYGMQYIDGIRAKSMKKVESVDKRMNNRLGKYKKY